MPRKSSVLYVADLFGRARAVSPIRRGSTVTFSLPRHQFDEDEEKREDDPAESVRARNLRDILATLERYDRSGRFTPKELLTLHRIWLQGWTLQTAADAEGVTRQAIRERIVGNRKGQGGILKKAPEFAKWWTFKNRRRRLKGPSNVD